MSIFLHPEASTPSLFTITGKKMIFLEKNI